MQFFVVSAGKPGSDYIDSNFKDIISSNEFALHPDTAQKGTYYSIEAKDILILKYNSRFVAYGIVIMRSRVNSKHFSLRVKVREWIKFDFDNPTRGISIYGIQNATIGGGRYGTVKTIRPNFGLDKIKEINDAHPDYEEVYQLYKENKTSLKKEGDFFSLHEELFNTLLDKAELDPEFTFVTRDSNNSKLLDNGYWFFGQETVAISFWTGMNFSQNIPAISLLINPNKHCELIIETETFENFRNFLNQENFFIEQLRIKKEGSVFKKIYSNYRTADYKACLEDFLKKDYSIINRIVDEFDIGREYDNSFSSNFIQKFPLNEFIFRINNIFRYRKLNTPGIDIYSNEDEKRADSIKNIVIKDYALIKSEFLDFDNANWVFITGENGAGKTMLLRAIGSALGNRTLSSKELAGKKFQVEATLETDGRQIFFSRTQNFNVKAKRNIVSRGLAMYGPYRLQQTSNLVKPETFRKALSKRGSFESLFEENSKLLSFDKQLELWTKSRKYNNSIVEMRISQTISLLPKIIPDLIQVRYIQKKYNKYEFKYIIDSNDSERPMTLNWSQLSSGNKSILNLVSDILIRLFFQQSKISDPSELRGIVIIDEIDLHLHPKAQRDLVVTLSETFPLIQFIVSTHSPIPLLGAPKNSAIFVVRRDCEKGIYTERLRKLENELDFLLPNTLLTSKIFDMDFFGNKSKNELLKIYTEDNYEDVRRNKIIEKNIRSLESDFLPENLFKEDGDNK